MKGNNRIIGRIESLQHLGSSNQKLGFAPLVLGRGLEAKLEERYNSSYSFRLPEISMIGRGGQGLK